MYTYRKIYLFLATVFLLPALAMVNIAYFSDYLHKFVMVFGLVFNIATTVFICDVLNIGHGDNYFVFCGPDYAYTKALTNFLIYVLPAIFFIYKLYKTRVKKSKWKSP